MRVIYQETSTMLKNKQSPSMLFTTGREIPTDILRVKGHRIMYTVWDEVRVFHPKVELY